MNLCLVQPIIVTEEEKLFYFAHLKNIIDKFSKDKNKNCCILADFEKKIIFTEVESHFVTENPLKHVIMLTIDKFSHICLNNNLTDQYLLNGLVMFVYFEPCLMCAMALTHSRLKRIIYIEKNHVYMGAMNEHLSITKLKTNHKIEVFQYDFESKAFISQN